ncbi:MAG: heme-binding domain-containing protein, partial [Solirubrobacterales bacterium]
PVAPASWLVQHDVDEGRSKMNLSEWDKPQPALDEVIGQVRPGGEMPPWQYTVMPNHADARLSDADRATLIRAFRELYAKEPPGAIKADGGGG